MTGGTFYDLNMIHFKWNAILIKDLHVQEIKTRSCLQVKLSEAP